MRVAVTFALLWLGGLAVVPFASAQPVAAQQETDVWFDWNRPADDDLSRLPEFDLRSLNEPQAGDEGFITISMINFTNPHGEPETRQAFLRSKTGRTIRFWGVNGPPASSKSPAELTAAARRLAAYGVNLVRIHGAVFDESGAVDPAKIRHVQEVVAAMKSAGIYSHLSIYFPLWFKPSAQLEWLPGYDGKMHPFAALQFNPEFQKRYAEWWRALLLTPHPETGVRLVDEPAVMGVELQNEDSFFFWTFSDKNLPEPQLQILETQFAEWLIEKHGSLDAALAGWRGAKLPRDNVAEKRIAFRPLWNMANERTPRDRETARFLAELQRSFYERHYKLLRELGFRATITCSNWTTASPKYLGPLEKYTYTVGDFLDRHGYFSGKHQGPFSEWSIRDGHTYRDRSGLKFEASEPGKPRSFGHPVMDVKYNDKPSMLSESTWTRPNRFRSEAPFFFAVYGALQGSDAIVHFAHDGAKWSVKPNFFMQPWTLAAPTQMGQFPVAALLYRQELVATGSLLADLRLDPESLLELGGTPLPPDASLDELRLKDVPLAERNLTAEDTIDPLLHFAGRARVRLGGSGPPSRVANLRPYIDRERQTVTSSTGQVRLDYRQGLLTVDAPLVALASGDLRSAKELSVGDLRISTPLDQLHLALVSLDNQPLTLSGKMLLQVMSEERTTGFRTEPVGTDGTRRILSIGRDPWQVRSFAGSVRFARPDASQLRLTPLDGLGQRFAQPIRLSSAGVLELLPNAPYYLIERAE